MIVNFLHVEIKKFYKQIKVEIKLTNISITNLNQDPSLQHTYMNMQPRMKMMVRRTNPLIMKMMVAQR